MPVLVKVISVYFFILAFFDVASGILALSFGDYLNEIFNKLGFYIGDSNILTGIGLLIIAFGVFYVFVGKDLWKGKNWAKTAAIIVSSMNVLFYAVSLSIGSFIFLAIDLAIVLYLLFNKEVKSVFS